MTKNPRCPICGAEADTFYYGKTIWDDTRQVVGCDGCIKTKEWWEVEEEDWER